MAMMMKTATTDTGGVMASFISSFPEIEEIGELDDDEVRDRSPSDDETMIMSKSQAQGDQGPPANENFDMPPEMHIKVVDKVSDWEARVAEYEPWRKDFVMKAVSIRKKFNEYLESPNWKQIDSNAGEKHAIFLMDTSNGRQAVKGVIEFPAKAMEIF